MPEDTPKPARAALPQELPENQSRAEPMQRDCVLVELQGQQRQTAAGLWDREACSESS